MIRATLHRLGISPRAWMNAFLSYPRFLGQLRPDLINGSEIEILSHLEELSRSSQIRKLTAPLGKRLLVVAPHPDDETLGCGGLLLAHQDQKIHVVNVFSDSTGGSIPGKEYSNSETYQKTLTEMRTTEFLEVTKRLKASFIQLNAPRDREFSEETRKTFRKAVLEFAPDVILLPWLLDTQPEHRMANQLLASTCADLNTIVLAYEIWGLLSPNAIFDFTDHAHEKMAILEVYRTQTESIDYVRYAHSLGAIRAFQHSVGDRRAGFAEAFFSLPCSEYCELVSRLK